MRVLAPLLLLIGVGLAGCTETSPEPPADKATRPVVPGGAPLAPGTYETQDFSRSLSFTVDEPAWRVVQEERDIVTLTTGGGTELAFATPRVVFVKRAAFVPQPAPLPPDLVAWLEERPDLVARRRSPVTLGGERAARVEVEVLELYEEAELLGCPLPCLPLAPGGGDEPLFLTHTHRVLVLEGDPPFVVVYSTGDPEGERAARALLETVRFTRARAR